MSTPVAPVAPNQDNFATFWNKISTQFSDQASREKIEDISVMVGSIALAECIPGFGEVQMALQFLDFIDPYGYNQAIDRDSLDKMLVKQYGKIQDMQTTLANCYTDGTGCDKVGVTSDMLAQFQALPTDLQAKRIKSITSWATPFPPEVNYPDMMLCTLATTPDRIQSGCTNDLYKQIYMDYWNQNAASYQANAQAAYEAAVAAAAATMSGDSAQDQVNTSQKNKIKIALSLAFVIVIIVCFIVFKKIFS